MLKTISDQSFLDLKAPPQKPAPEKRPPGKPSLSGGGESPVLNLRMPADLKARCQRNGLNWAREVLAAAPDPALQ